MVQTITKDSIIFALQGTTVHSYIVNIDYPLLADNQLASVKVNGNVLPEFNASTYLYQVEVNRKEKIVVESETALFKQQLNVAYMPIDSIIGFEYLAISPNKADSTITRVEFSTRLEVNPYLADILLDGESLIVERDNYISDASFSSTLLNYGITLKCETPKQQQPQIPAISAIAGRYGQTINIQNNGLNEDALIEVVAEDGTEVTYEIGRAHV